MEIIPFVLALCILAVVGYAMVLVLKWAIDRL